MFTRKIPSVLEITGVSEEVAKIIQQFYLNNGAQPLEVTVSTPSFREVQLSQTSPKHNHYPFHYNIKTMIKELYDSDEGKTIRDNLPKLMSRVDSVHGNEHFRVNVYDRSQMKKLLGYKIYPGEFYIEGYPTLENLSPIEKSDVQEIWSEYADYLGGNLPRLIFGTSPPRI